MNFHKTLKELMVQKGVTVKELVEAIDKQNSAFHHVDTLDCVAWVNPPRKQHLILYLFMTLANYVLSYPLLKNP